MNRSLRLLLVGALAFAAAGAATVAPLSAQGKNLAQGAKEKDIKQTKEAKKLLEKATAAGTPEAAAPFYQAALDSAKSAIALDDNNPLPHRQAGEALLGLGRVKEAASELDKAETLRPIYTLQTGGLREKAWIDQYQLAQPMLSGGNYDSAAVILESANAIYRERPEIMIVLGQIYAQGKDPMKSIPYLQAADSLIKSRIAEVDSSMAKSWKEQQADLPVTMAQAYITAKEYDKASATLRGLVEANPSNLMYARSLANVYGQSNKPDSAAAVYVRLLGRSDLTPNDLFQVGIGLYSIDKFQDAAQAFRKETQVASKDRDAFEMWARSLQLAQNRDSTLATPANLTELQTAAEGWVALDPSSRVGMLILAQTTNKQKNEARTNELVQKMDALPVGLTNLQLRRNSTGGGASLSGEIENYKATQGNPVTLDFTFFDRAGNALGTQTTRVPAAAKDGKIPFNVDFKSDKEVDGYTYTLTL